jgi:hypothetical protein
MAVSRCAPRVEIAPPRSTRRPFGLYSVAEVRDVEDGHWSHGIQYRTEACSGNVYAWPKPCPPACEPDCFEATTITVRLVHEVEDRDCGDVSKITASVTAPATPADLPFRTIISVWVDSCGTSVDLTPGDTEVTVARTPARAGALKPHAVTVRESYNGTEKTVSLAPQATTDVVLTADPDQPRRKVLDGIGPWIGSDPVPLYSSVHCTPGSGFAEEAKRITEDRLACQEECAVEDYLWTQLSAGEAQYVGNPAAPKTFLCAMAELEAATARERSCTTGVLHVPARLSLPLSSGGCCLIEEEGRALTTRLGTKIALGACYDDRMRPDGVLAAEDQVVLIATGPVVVQRGPISSYEGLDKVTNDYAAIAERTFGIIADCPLFWTVAKNCS